MNSATTLGHTDCPDLHHFIMSRLIAALPLGLFAALYASTQALRYTSRPPKATVPPQSQDISALPNVESSSSYSESQPSPTRRNRMPARFTIEDPDTVLDLERNRPPPVGDAALHCGLAVDLAAW